MKNKLLCLLAFTLFYSSHAQTTDWSVFKQNSLRCYQKYTGQYQDHSLSGIDFRTYYTEPNGDVMYKMDSFSKIRTIEVEERYPFFEKYYLTGNSVLGYRVRVSDNLTTLYFVNDSIKTINTDSFVFVNTPKLGVTWTCYEDSTIVITGENTNLKLGNTPNGMDSIRTIKVSTTQKATGLQLDYTLEVGKSYGLLQILDFGEFIHYPHNSYFTSIHSLKPYREMSEREFFKIRPGTEIHSGGGTPQFKNGWAIQRFYKIRYYLQNGSLVRDLISLETRDSNYMDPNPNNVISVEKWDSTMAEVVMQKDTSDEIFNPLPNSFNTIIPYGYAVSLVCDDRLYTVHRVWNIGGSSTVRLSEDSLGLTYSEGEMTVYSNSYMTGVGHTSNRVKTHVAGPSDSYWSTQYIKTDSCEIGEKLPQLNSVSKLEARQVRTYPNPASHYISLGDLNFVVDEVQIYNIVGTQVNGKLTGTNQLDVSSLTAGIYFLQFTKENQLYRGKFVKE